MPTLDGPLTQDETRTWWVVRALYERATKRGARVDLLQLEKIAYIAHGFSLACFDAVLLHERVGVGRFGPTLASLDPLRLRHGSLPLESGRAGTLFAEAGQPGTLDQETGEVLARVPEAYGSHPGWRLSALTRSENGAYARAVAEGRRWIETRAIQDDFLRLISPTRQRS